MALRMQIVPVEGFRLFGALVKKEIGLSKRSQGTFLRGGPKIRNKAKWVHKTYTGWINLERSAGEIVTLEIRSRQETAGEWKLLHAFVGFVARHFASHIAAMHIHFPKNGRK
jgi:hypothetical protein